MTKEIKDLLKNLSFRERDVIRLLFGLDDGRSRTPEEIAALFGVSKDEIIKIAESGLSKLPISFEELKSMCEKAAEELKNKITQIKPRRTLSDTDSELLNMKFFENSEK